MHLRIVVLTFILSCVTCVNAQSISKVGVDSRWRTSFELMPIDTDDMGLLGLHYDIFPFEQCNGCYAGVGGYSGATGEEGGFFTAGLTAGWVYNLNSNFKTDIGFHIGGGGGSEATYPGGGLIVRTHAAIQYIDTIGISLGIANMGFPNSTKEDKFDTHLYTGLIIPTSIWLDSLDGGGSIFSGEHIGFRVSPAFLLYRPEQKPITKSGGYTAGTKNDNIPLMGIQLSWHDGNIFYPIEMYGAAGGGVDGYATLFGGIGYNSGLMNNMIAFEGKALLGVGGDGRLDTGGGALFQPMLGLRARLTESLSVAAFLGKTIGLDGEFEATSAEFSLSWSSDMPKATTGVSSIFDNAGYDISSWYGSLANKTYFPSSGLLQTDGEEFDRELHLFGVELEKPVNNWLSLIGNTFWAHTGNIGSYAEGALGAKANLASFSSVDIFTQAELIVAGGGDVEVDKGFMGALGIGAGFEIYDGMFIDVNCGYTTTTDGSFKAKTLIAKARWQTDSIFR